MHASLYVHYFIQSIPTTTGSQLVMYGVKRKELKEGHSLNVCSNEKRFRTVLSVIRVSCVKLKPSDGEILSFVSNAFGPSKF